MGTARRKSAAKSLRPTEAQQQQQQQQQRSQQENEQRQVQRRERRRRQQVFLERKRQEEELAEQQLQLQQQQQQEQRLKEQEQRLKELEQRLRETTAALTAALETMGRDAETARLRQEHDWALNSKAVAELGTARAFIALNGLTREYESYYSAAHNRRLARQIYPEKQCGGEKGAASGT